MRFALPVLCLVAGALSSCRSPDSGSEGPSSFSRAFEAFEFRRGSDSAERPRGTLVDYDSEILVQPDRARLAAIAGTSSSATSSAEVVQLQAQLEDAGRVEPLLTAIAEYEVASRNFFANDFADGLILQDDARWRAFTQKQLEVVEGLRELVYVYVNQTKWNGKWNWRAQELSDMGLDEASVLAANEDFDRVYLRLSPSGETYEGAEVTKLVNELTAVLRGRIADLERAILAASPLAELEMEAALLRGKQRLPVSIDPYTKVEGVGRGAKSQRVGVPSREDVERVQKQYEVYSDLADSINELIELAGDEEALGELRDGLLRALESLAENLAEGLEARLRQLLQNDAFVAVRTDAEALLAELEAIRADIDRLLRSAKSSDPVTLTNNTLAVLGRIGEKGETGLQAKFEAFTRSLAALPTLPDAARAAADSLSRVVEEEAGQLSVALQGQPAVGSVANLFNALEKLGALAGFRSFGDLESGAITRQPFAIDQAPNGVVNLAATPAEAGDVLEVSYRMRVPTVPPPGAASGSDVGGSNGGDPRVREYQGADFLDVRKFGFYSTYSAQILFFDRLTDGSSSFRAAPGVSYNLHYRPEGAQSFHDLVAPGLGLSVSAPSFETGTELAVGMQLTLFNDMLQGGYAYNISVSSDPWMFYFALDLIAAFQALP